MGQCRFLFFFFSLNELYVLFLSGRYFEISKESKFNKVENQENICKNSNVPKALFLS